MSMTFIVRIGLVSVLLTAMGCAPAVVTPMPPTVRRIAVLPPYYLGAADTPAAGTDSDLLRPLQMTVGDVLAQQARMRLAERGLDVIDTQRCEVGNQGSCAHQPADGGANHGRGPS